MFKAKIVVNKNGKQTVLEFDNEQEYYDYLESHPEINQSFDRTNHRPAFGRNPWNLSDEMFNLSNHPFWWLSHKQLHKDLSPLALVRQDMQRIEYEEKKKEAQAREQEQKKEQNKKELEEAKVLLKNYKAKEYHDDSYAAKLEAYIESLEKNC